MMEATTIRCEHCGYELSGTAVGSMCPECGMSVIDSLMTEGGIRVREAIAVLLRLAALLAGAWYLYSLLWFLVFAVAYFFGLLDVHGANRQYAPFLLWQGVLHLVGLIVVAVLWLISRTLSRWMVWNDRVILNREQGFDPKALACVLMIVLAVYVSLTGLAGLIGGFADVMMNAYTDADSEPQTFGSLVASVIRPVIGLLLLFSPAFLNRITRALSHASLRSPHPGT